MNKINIHYIDELLKNIQRNVRGAKSVLRDGDDRDSRLIDTAQNVDDITRQIQYHLGTLPDG
jgi:hypothetical protein